jgi:hypothetical protein
MICSTNADGRPLAETISTNASEYTALRLPTTMRGRRMSAYHLSSWMPSPCDDFGGVAASLWCKQFLRVTIDLAKSVFWCRAMEVCLQCELVPEPHTLATRDGATRTQPCSCQCRNTLLQSFCLRQSKFIAPCLATGRDCPGPYCR